jgi:Holliday junction resolvase
VEAKLQAEIIKWLKSKGAYVIKNRSGPGVPVGCPDITFLYEGAWGVIEVKAHSKSPYRVGQELTLARLADWSPFVFTVHPDNWHYTQEELLNSFF